MPFTLPTAVSAGSVLTATSYNQAVRSNAMFGMPTFDNQTSRDAALTSPEEGMRAYLTAPTTAIVDATGATTLIPTGVTTVYNGSVWVVTTPVGAFTDATGTRNAASFSASLGGSPGTNPTVKLVTGTTALVSIYAELWTADNTGTYMGVAVSGAGTVAATIPNSASNANAYVVGSGMTFVLSGLTAGVNTFELQYYGSATVGNFRNRKIVVQGIA